MVIKKAIHYRLSTLKKQPYRNIRVTHWLSNYNISLFEDFYFPRMHKNSFLKCRGISKSCQWFKAPLVAHSTQSLVVLGSNPSFIQNDEYC